jgi:lysozyme family protein
MIENFPAALKALLKHEGGYVNHPSDPGGMTNLGVTKRVWEEFTGQTSSEADMRLLTPSQVAPLYKQRYWDACKCDDLPSGVDYCVFDAAVNSGPKQASKWLQRAVGVADDGAIGKMTVAAVIQQSAADVVHGLNEQRLAFLEGLKTFPVFGKGWSRRVTDVQLVASAMTQTSTA